MKQWVWIAPSVILAVHDEQIFEHGGSTGMRNRGLLESTLERPKNLAVSGKADHADLAACYGVSIARDRPFFDGNERTAFVAVELFLILNTYEFSASDADAVLTMLGVSAGRIDATRYADWIRQYAKR